MNRYVRRVPAAEAELALLEMLDLFPDGVEEEADGDQVVLSGFAETGSGRGLECVPVADGWLDAWREYHHGSPVRLAVGRTAVGAGGGAGGGDRSRARIRHRRPRLDPRRARAPADVAAAAALDLGCGSGVLSIAAMRLGFGPLRPSTSTRSAIEASAENAARNGVWFEVERRDVLSDPLPEAPLWIANLQLDLLERLLARTDLPPVLLVSGLLESQTLGGSPRAVVDGWAAEVLRP